MALERAIGRWAMTALVVNCIIGSGIFGVPSELIRLLGRFSPVVMVLAALTMGIIAASIAEVASQFSEPGGLYLYARVAFGRFVGLQISWFWLLAAVGGGAAGANLFVLYLGTFVPSATHGWVRLFVLFTLITVPTVANYVGVRSGVILSNSLTVAKLLPIGLLIVLGLVHGLGLLHPHSSSSPALDVRGAGGYGLQNWLQALLLLIFSFGGYEDALVPTGEVKNPRRTIPFALGIGLPVCALVYTLLQYVIVTTIGARPSEHPLVDTASVLIGGGGSVFVAVAVMLSTYGWISAGFLNAPRLVFSLAEQGDCPALFGRLHPRFQTPSVGILLYAALVAILAATGTFLWVLALAAGSMMVLYGVGCAALIRLRSIQPAAPALRIPFGRAVAVTGIIFSIVLITQLEKRQILLMGLTASIAAANWVWARQQASVRSFYATESAV